MRRSWHTTLLKSGIVYGLVSMLASTVAAQGSDRRKPNWPTSEFHHKLDGNGNVIPCRCLFRGQSHPLGAVVCMNTHKGMVLTACDLVQNNTSWVASDDPCTISQLPQPHTPPHMLAAANAR